jgi:beta-lactamase superfamily II metal-dependent hydrolase
MPNNPLGKILDPKFPKYVYAANPLVTAYEKKRGKKKQATLFMGEWMKILEEEIPQKGRAYVRFRGGNGYVDLTDMTYSRFLEIFFIDVDQGDSILIQTPDDRRILIDGGKSDEAHRFIRDKYNLHARNNYIDFEAIVATHSDNDHAGGLIKILKDPKIAVKRFYHNGLFRRKDSSQDPGPKESKRIFGLEDSPKVDDSPALKALMQRIIKAVDQAKSNLPVVIKKMKTQDRWKDRIEIPEGGFVFKRLDAFDEYLPPYDRNNKYVTIEVLWPSMKKVNERLSYPEYGDAGKTVNGNSIVLCIKHGKQRILLTGDLNLKSMNDLLSRYSRGGANPADRLRAEVYKAAHHGSQDFSVPFLKAVKPDAAVISSGDDRYDQHGHPRAVLMGTITRYSKYPMPAVFSTELAACYSPISLTKEQRKLFAEGKFHAYEKSIQGIVHLRSDGRRLVLGTVHGRKGSQATQLRINWKWDIWP